MTLHKAATIRYPGGGRVCNLELNFFFTYTPGLKYFFFNISGLKIFFHKF
jgi:hypothetical protein